MKRNVIARVFLAAICIVLIFGMIPTGALSNLLPSLAPDIAPEAEAVAGTNLRISGLYYIKINSDTSKYMTNSNCRSYIDYDGSEVSAMIDKYFVSDLDISYTFKVKGLKRATIGCTIYNIFNEEYETHGACGLYFTKGADGKPQPYHAGGWSYSVYSAQAPVHVLAHLSVEW
jgi:hypothetical protein